MQDFADITPSVTEGRKLIEAYGDGRFRISGGRVEGSVLVFPERVEPWPVARFEEVTLDSLAAVFAAEPRVEVLLVGCGARHRRAPRAVRDGLREAGIGADFMDTGAACRTFNVLLAEERRVAAALIAV